MSFEIHVPFLQDKACQVAEEIYAETTGVQIDFIYLKKGLFYVIAKIPNKGGI